MHVQYLNQYMDLSIKKIINIFHVDKSNVMLILKLLWLSKLIERVDSLE